MSGTNGGDVEYLIRADDSNIEADLERANKKVCLLYTSDAADEGRGV